MALITFQNLPSTTTPINATNLNNNFTECNNIVASGSNEYGFYIKYSDGTLIQYGSVEASANTNYGTINFPIAFINTDYEILVNHKYRGGSDYGGSAQIRCITTGQVSTASLGYVYSVYSDGTSPSYKRNCTYYAIGKWK